MPLLSVIIPVYNVEKYLDECIASVEAQTLKDIEIILIDDESPDNCPTMCDEYAKKDNRIKVIHKKNGGLGFARNSGLEIATGKYVTFLDSDDKVSAEAYSRLIKIAENNELDFVRFSFNRFADDGRKTTEMYDKKPIFFDKKDIRQLGIYLYDVNLKSKYSCGGSSCMAIFKREVIETNHLRFVSERQYTSEDFIFTLIFYQKSNRAAYIGNTYYHYRLNPGGITKKLDFSKLKKIENTTKYVLQLVSSNESDKDQVDSILGYYLGNIRNQSRIVFTSNLSLKTKKSWFYNNMQGDFFKYAMKKYPYNRMPIKQRILNYLFLKRDFYLALIVIYIFTYLRRETKF